MIILVKCEYESSHRTLVPCAPLKISLSKRGEVWVTHFCLTFQRGCEERHWKLAAAHVCPGWAPGLGSVSGVFACLLSLQEFRRYFTRISQHRETVCVKQRGTFFLVRVGGSCTPQPALSPRHLVLISRYSKGHISPQSQSLLVYIMFYSNKKQNILLFLIVILSFQSLKNFLISSCNYLSTLFESCKSS